MATLILLVLGVALLAFPCGVLALLVRRARAEDQPAGEPFSVLSVAQAFDPDCAIIWDTQLPALQLVDRAGLGGIRARQLYPFYTRSTRCYPELYDGTKFGGWLDFLEREQLIRQKAGRAFITAEGREFLAYRVVPEAALVA